MGQWIPSLIHCPDTAMILCETLQTQRLLWLILHMSSIKPKVFRFGDSTPRLCFKNPIHHGATLVLHRVQIL